MIWRIATKLGLVITEKGVSDLAQHFVNKVSVTAVCRLRKSDHLRVARAYKAPIANRKDEIAKEDIRNGARLFEVRKLRDKCFTSLEQCKDLKTCPSLPRGANKDLRNEGERARAMPRLQKRDRPRMTWTRKRRNRSRRRMARRPNPKR